LTSARSMLSPRSRAVDVCSRSLSSHVLPPIRL
jgi:hypothetical protein